MKKSDKHILIFGGSFDPPHLAHMEMLMLAVKALRPDVALIIPALSAASTSKNDGDEKSHRSSYEHRSEMTRLALKECLSPEDLIKLKSDISKDIKIEVSEIEKTLPTPSYTVNTLSELQKEYPSAKFTFLLGQDQIKNFDQWHQAGDILRKANLATVKRQGESVDLRVEAEQTLKRMGLSVSLSEDKTKLYIKDTGSLVYIIDENISAAQSTLIRNKNGEESWVSKSVANYISTNKLYH